MEQLPLFDIAPYPIEEPGLRFQNNAGPVWTNNKARLIQRYVRYFTFITKHGTYIDTFAGPQESDHPDSWAAKLVLEQEPPWMRNFALFELNAAKVSRIKEMVAKLKPVPKRDIKVYAGDMNQNLKEYFRDFPIKDKEATFCLLDQHTFECDWATVEMVACHKGAGNKIEQFYFLAQSWIDRAEAGMKNEKEERLNRWWGNDGWKTLLQKPGLQRGFFLADRFKTELGYKYAYSFAIYENPPSEGHGKVMFYMIHASDHPEAPKLMLRAYNKAVTPLEPIEQMEMELAEYLPGVQADE